MTVNIEVHPLAKSLLDNNTRGLDPGVQLAPRLLRVWIVLSRLYDIPVGVELPAVEV